MRVSAHTQAIVLLTSALSARSAARPLTDDEWARFADWLEERGGRPEDLLGDARAALLQAWRDPEIEAARLGGLLDRGSALAVALDRWLKAGLWIITTADPSYPSRLSERLGRCAPPVLFGCGDETLLGRGGIAIVGSRQASPADLEYAWHLGARVAEGGLTVISGGASGVEEEAMAGAIEAGGPVVGVLPGGLLSATAESRYRSHLMEGEMALISASQPDALIEGREALRRNQVIYCLSDAAVAVHSGKTGGTFSGASRVLREDWIPLWVRTNADPDSGNAELIAAGGHALTLDAARVNPALLSMPDCGAGESAGLCETAANAIYESFLMQARNLCGDEAKAPEELAVALGLTKKQLEIWLARAVTEEHLVKHTDPDRYERKKAGPGQLTLFEE
jgi:predicted Rossmann fold nucleotide-binding protein DprA/Smf involved in DNA uptake